MVKEILRCFITTEDGRFEVIEYDTGVITRVLIEPSEEYFERDEREWRQEQTNPTTVETSTDAEKEKRKDDKIKELEKRLEKLENKKK